MREAVLSLGTVLDAKEPLSGATRVITVFCLSLEWSYNIPHSIHYHPAHIPQHTSHSTHHTLRLSPRPRCTLDTAPTPASSRAINVAGGRGSHGHRGVHQGASYTALAGCSHAIKHEEDGQSSSLSGHVSGAELRNSSCAAAGHHHHSQTSLRLDITARTGLRQLISLPQRVPGCPGAQRIRQGSSGEPRRSRRRPRRRLQTGEASCSSTSCRAECWPRPSKGSRVFPW